MANVDNPLRALPGVDQFLQSPTALDLISAYGRPLTLEATRQVLGDLRVQMKDGETPPGSPALADLVRQRLAGWLTPSLVPVINASGVILHTNLGRAPLAQSALEAIIATANGYSTLEYDLGRGERGTRMVHAEELLKRISGAQAALVVNNNAAAVLLALSALATRQRVIISRTQLVEIGGGFRVPDVMKQSGAKLVEVGATNRVHLRDYEEALQEPAALVLRAHSSNFRMLGFTSEPPLSELVETAHRLGVMVMDDIGSGAVLDTTHFGMGHEPMVQESLACGVDLVCFSGDKLLGGPQAGIIAGRADLIAKIKKHPLYRAVRADKLCLAALSATLVHYLKDEAQQKIPVWMMISMTAETIQARAQRWNEILGLGTVIPGESTVGGGSLPGEVLPTFLLAFKIRQPNHVLKILRTCHPPVIARIHEDALVLDPRTVLAEQEDDLLEALRETLLKLGL